MRSNRIGTIFTFGKQTKHNGKNSGFQVPKYLIFLPCYSVVKWLQMTNAESSTITTSLLLLPETLNLIIFYLIASDQTHRLMQESTRWYHAVDHRHSKAMHCIRRQISSLSIFFMTHCWMNLCTVPRKVLSLNILQNVHIEVICIMLLSAMVSRCLGDGIGNVIIVGWINFWLYETSHSL